jgi:intein/homing endonuclease
MKSMQMRFAILLAYDQDYGREQNAVGFSRFDTGIGHSLASIPFEQWSPAQLVQAHKVLSRYKNTQLPGLGYAWADMPDVSNVSVVRDAGTKTAGFAEIDIENGAFLFRWGGADPYFSSRVEDARGLPGARYDKNTKAWSVPITMNSIDAVSDVLAKYAKTELPFCESSDFHDGINDAITAVTAKLEASSAKSVSRETLRLHRVTNPDIVRPFQLAGIKWCVENKQTILSDDMGCISGDAKVSVSRGGGTRIRTMRQLYEGFNGLSKNKWRDDIPTLVRCLKGDRFGNHEIRAVLDKGVRSVVRVSLANGKSIVCTPDHELRMFTGEWVPASELRPGDIVTTNGQEVCKECGSSENVITSPNAKFRGYCRVCMYRVHRAKPTWKGGRSLDKDGYVRLSGHRDHPEANQHGQILEHRYVMEKFLGRYLASGELVHHINEIKDDNRIENLEIVSSGDHMRKHDVRLRMDGGGTINGGEVIVLPRGVEVVSVEDAGEDHVYDVVMADPYRNFVADGIVVHNCGKSLQSLVAVAEDDAFPCLIICPSSLKLNWKREIGLWIRDGQRGEPNIFVASGTKPKGIPVLGGPIDFFIINYDIVHAWQDIISSYPWKSVIADECLPYDQTIRTSEGDVKIGDVVRTGREGKAWYVLSYNDSNSVSEYRKVTGFFENSAKMNHVRVTYHGGEIQCTGNHLVYTGRGYVPASEVQRGDNVLVLREEEARSQEGESNGQVLQQRMHNEMAIGEYGLCREVARPSDSACGRGVCVVRDGVSEGAKFGEEILWAELLGQVENVATVVKGDCPESNKSCTRQEARDQRPIDGQKDAREQSYVGPGSKGEGACIVDRNGAQATSTGREWTRNDRSAGEIVERFGDGLGCGVACPDNAETGEWVSNCIQGGYCEPSEDDCSGVRRGLTFSNIAPDAGCQEGQILEWSRVESVEVLQQDDYGRVGIYIGGDPTSK